MTILVPDHMEVLSLQFHGTLVFSVLKQYSLSIKNIYIYVLYIPSEFDQVYIVPVIQTVSESSSLIRESCSPCKGEESQTVVQGAPLWRICK